MLATHSIALTTIQDSLAITQQCNNHKVGMLLLKGSLKNVKINQSINTLKNAGLF